MILGNVIAGRSVWGDSPSPVVFVPWRNRTMEHDSSNSVCVDMRSRSRADLWAVNADDQNESAKSVLGVPDLSSLPFPLTAEELGRFSLTTGHWLVCLQMSFPLQTQ